jgi:hypothetical protein
MTTPVPTVDDVLEDTAVGCGRHQWLLDDGSMVELHTSQLRPALEAAYDPGDTNWPLCVHIEEA